MNKYCRLLIQSTGTVGRMRDWADLFKKESQWPDRDYSGSFFDMTALMDPGFRNTRIIRIWVKTMLGFCLPTKLIHQSFKQSFV